MASSYQTLISDVGPLSGIILVFISGTWWIIKKLRSLTKKFEEFIEDWSGVEGRPGVSPRVGIMERLSNQDSALGEINKRLVVVENEVGHDNGKSLKDTVHKVNNSVHRIEDTVKALNGRVSNLEAGLDH